MSILIKGMDMPTSCADCQMYVTDIHGNWCVICDMDIDDDTEIDADCPIVPVPTPHGRLIDATGVDNATATKPKKGKWIPDSFFKDEPCTNPSIWKCSCCGASVYRTDECNYCYNCGADMRGGENG